MIIIFIKLGYVNVVKILLENGANANAVDSYGNTPLHWSAFSGKYSGFLSLSIKLRFCR